ncbi:ECF-type sigma factor [Nonomuraea sp. CA-143628]|uniref:ECF-type sigma factor n=1 Tax=Nonomuraea sp. CA-143628 TaxID=3239997 RepID=UPI003D92AF4E
MRHTDEEIERAAMRFEQLADALPDDVEFDDVSELRAIAETSEQVRADEARLTEAVAVARAHGHSWNHIATALGVSRQAARQKYADKVA